MQEGRGGRGHEAEALPHLPHHCLLWSWRSLKRWTAMKSPDSQARWCKVLGADLLEKLELEEAGVEQLLVL